MEIRGENYMYGNDVILERTRDLERESGSSSRGKAGGERERHQEMNKRTLTIDAWIREAQEASKLVEDAENTVRNKSSLQQELQEHEYYRFMDTARSKLLEVGVKLDRLESLLHNPPTKPILTKEDLEHRWEMLSDIQLRTRALAFSLYTLPSPNRPGGSLASDTKETNTGCRSCDEDEIKILFSKDNLELLKPLVSADANLSQVQDKQCSYFSLKSFLLKACRITSVILGAAALLFLLVVLCAFI